ncbi:hypothetical protein ACH4GE_35860 [Streptomyces tendae]|uniref:hypothetical protein n=1 Tax=Streptomyces tendae TaxID=1932 RepID=UPI0037A3838F
MSEPTTPESDDTPAVALGPTSLILGTMAAVGAWPTLLFVAFPWTLLSGALSVTFGVAGLYYACHGVGRRWVSGVGTLLGAIALAGVLAFLAGFGT